MATFKRFQATVGSPSSSPAPTTVYTVPASKTSVVTGLTVSNISDFELPLDIFVTVGTDDYYKGCDWPGQQQLAWRDGLGADGSEVRCQPSMAVRIPSLFGFLFTRTSNVGPIIQGGRNSKNW